MTSATLPATEAPDPVRAVTDRAYYDRIVYQLDGKALAAFVDAVIAAAPAPAPQHLTEREMRILRFAALRFRHPGQREQAIREKFDLSATRFYQLLVALIDRPEAAAYAPVTVNRLRAVRAARQAARQNHTTEGSAA